MLTVDEYRSGKIFEFMKQSDIAVELQQIPLIKNIVRKKVSCNQSRGMCSIWKLERVGFRIIDRKCINIQMRR